MVQDELWLSQYNEVKAFIETNHRNPSCHRIEDYHLLNWLKQKRKLLNARKLKEDRVTKFEKLLELAGVCDTIKKIIQTFFLYSFLYSYITSFFTSSPYNNP